MSDKKVKESKCKACGDRGVEPDGPKCLECPKPKKKKKSSLEE